MCSHRKETSGAKMAGRSISGWRNEDELNGFELNEDELDWWRVCLSGLMNLQVK